MSDTISAEDYAALMAKEKPSKYRNVKVEEDGYTFDSKAEHRRYKELRLMEEAGEIKNLLVHPSYPLFVNDTRIGRYVGDFLYDDMASGGVRVVEDVKSTGTRTPTYRLKKKLMKACHGIDIIEVTA